VENVNDFFGDIIDSYSRAQAIEDGVLVDVSESSEAKECGFKFPVAMTRSVWDRYVEIPEGVGCQNLKGRLWDVLWMLRYEIMRGPGGRDRFLYKLHVRNDNRDRTPPPVTLKAICGPGDTPEPVITIMLPDED